MSDLALAAIGLASALLIGGTLAVGAWLTTKLGPLEELAPVEDDEECAETLRGAQQ